MTTPGFERRTDPDPSTDADHLDDSQRAVLALADGASAAVIGAPGTGKTTTLVELVADRVLRRGYSPSEVLVLVPTRSGATSLRDRLALRLGVPTNGPLARTANSLAFQIVRDAEARAGGTSPTLLTGGEQDQIIAELLAGHLADGTGPAWPDPLGPEVRRLRGFRTELRDLMMRAVEYGVTPARLAALGRDAARPEWVAAAEFIRGYEEVKDQTRPGQYDSTELAQYAAAVVHAAPRGHTPAGALGALGGLRLIVLDDAQETTQGTLALLARFAARGVAIVAFGDPDISTGSFRGAHPDALGRLGAYLGVDTAPALILGRVHRHGPALRAVVNEVTGRIGAAAAGTQRSVSVSPAVLVHAAPPVQAAIAASPAEQLAVIARRLRERHVIGGVPWGQMAVIVRTGSLVPALSKGLAALEVPTQVATAQTALRDEHAVRAFILALEVTLGRRALDADAAVDLLRGPLGGLDPITLRRLRAALRQQALASEDERAGDERAGDERAGDERAGDERAGDQRSPDQLLVEALTVPGALAMIDNRTARKTAAFGESLRTAAAEYRAGATIEELLWGLWQRSRLADLWFDQSAGTGIVADEANRNLDAVVALFAAAQRFVERTPAAPPVLFLEHLVDTDVPEDTLAPRALGDAVVVSTPSGTIGREFEVVVLAGLQENVWPDLRVRGSLLGAGELAGAAGGQDRDADPRRAVLHDELRMFAQAASRATGELLLTAVDDEDHQPSVFATRLLENLLPDKAPGADSASLYPLSLRGMVGRLRSELTGALRRAAGPDELTGRRAQDAAATLARLARESVAGAAPLEWYGIRGQSTTRPLNDPDAGDGPVRVSPSKMSAVETCPLHWMIGQVSGGGGSTAANLGTIIHKVMEDATDISPESLWQHVEARWGELVFDADWQSRLQKLEARTLTDRLASYLRDAERAGTTLLSAEGRFTLEVGGAVLSGTVDRVERLSDGRAVIVDLKTGKGDPTADSGVAEHPQLGAYQLAFHDGAIAGIPAGSELAGARLLIVSSGTQKQNYRNPTQQAFTPEQIETFRTRVGDDAKVMGGAVFLAEIANHCLDPWSFGSCRIHVIKQVSS